MGKKLTQEQFDLLDRMVEESLFFPDENREQSKDYRICEELSKIGILKKSPKSVNHYGVTGTVFRKPFPPEN